MDFVNRNIVVVGMGKTALAVTRLLSQKGANVFVSESTEREGVTDAVLELEASSVSYETGGHTQSKFLDADAIVPGPGVPWSLPEIVAARSANVPVFSELEVASQWCKSPMIAVTGTNGKTTTTEMITAMLKACGASVALAGNNACPLSQTVLDCRTPDVMVVEVSSYQLEGVETFRPKVGVWLNLTSDHLSRHGDMDSYGEVKSRLFSRQGPDDTAVLNADDPAVWAYSDKVPGRVVSFSESATRTDGFYIRDNSIMHDGEVLDSLEAIPVPGRHNRANALAAIAAVDALGYPLADALSGLRSFQGVEHRIEKIAEYNGASIYNDSKSTNVDSLRVALDSFETPIVLIAGGRGKGESYGSLRPLVIERVAFLVTLGEDAPRIEAELGEGISLARAADMEEAVKLAFNATQPGMVMLFSPGCASFDMYSSFEERGKHFKEIVERRLSGATDREAQHAT